MLDFFLQVDLLGKLYIEDVFFYYDEPLVFSCKNLFGHLFLVNCIDFDKESKTWLLLPITSHKLIQVKKRNISIYDAFTKPEDQYLWKVTKKLDNNIGLAIQVTPNDLTPDDLPTTDAYIEVEEVSETQGSSENYRYDLAQKENRIVFDVSLEVNEGHSTEISPEILSKSIMEIQNTLYSIAHKSGSINSNFPKSVIDDNQLSITETYAASFGIRFMSKQLCDLIGDTNVSRNIDIFMSLLEAKNDSTRIREILNDLNPKVGLHYKKMLSVLIKNKTGLKTYFTTPKNYNKEVFLSLAQIKDSLDTLESEIDNKSRKLTYSGKLVGVNVENKTFSFIPTEEKKIDGKLASDVNVEKFTVPLDVDVVIEEMLIINQLTRKEQVEYTLLSVR